MGGNFAYLLPFTMGMFGCLFLVIWRWNARPALYWGTGYLCSATGFCIPAIAPFLPTIAWGIIADTLFTAAFFCYGHAVLVDRRPRWLIRTRLLIVMLSVALCSYAVLTGNIRLELAASDLSCAAILIISLAGALGHFVRPIDRALVAILSLIALETLVRGSTVWLTTPDGMVGGYLETDYAFFTQAAASLLGLLLALTVLGAMTADVVAGYRIEALTDPLTGMLNRRGFDDAIARLWPRRARGSCVLICDLDRFKRVNDLFGHGTGDRVIVTFASLIGIHLPDGAVAARFGGEEFVVYLPGCDAAAASRFAEQVRMAMAGHDWGLPTGEAVTASFGLSAVIDADTTVHVGIGRADAGLGDAKLGGRNRVVIA